MWPKAQEFGFADEYECFGLQFGHGLGLGLHERPIISRLNSLDDPVEIKAGMVFALETYCPSTDGKLGSADRGGDRRDRDRPRGHHALPVRGAARRQRVLSAGR